MTQAGPDWRSIPGYEGYYEVSTRGGVRSSRRSGARGGALRPSPNSRGFPSVSLSREGQARTWAVNELMLMTFAGPRPSPAHKAQHLNQVKSDNRWPENLAWVAARRPARHPSRRAALGHYKAGEPMCDLCEARIPHGISTGYKWGCRCPSCCQAEAKAAATWRAKQDPEKLNAGKRAWDAANPEKSNASKKAWRLANKEKQLAGEKAYRSENPEMTHLSAARARARAYEVPFDLTREYVRELIDASDHCPICGITYERAESSGCAPASRTLDRNVPSLGYVMGNVSFMCAADNTRKGRRTLAEYIAWRSSDVA